MRFIYTYRSSDGQRRTAEIEAESRDAAFAAIRREMGVKPIKVTAVDAVMPGKSEDPGKAGKYRRLVAGVLLLAVFVALAFLAWRGGLGRPPAQFTVDTPQGPVTYTYASPLPRQAIPGDRQRFDGKRDSIFANSAERYLSRFAEPGRAPAVSDGERPAEADFEACLGDPIRIASTDFTEVVDLKRIVTGMKREMRAYIAGGGTVSQYVSELAKRQRLEVSYRESAEKRLNVMLDGQDDQSSGKAKKEAYSYWLKANASLKSMGIYELPLPAALHSYQSDFDFTE